MRGEASKALQSKQNIESEKPLEAALITVERAQKLDLLIHLISNLRQSLVICGPKGIGKTALLDELKVRQHNEWSICTIQAVDSLSFEAVQKKIKGFLVTDYPEYRKQELVAILDRVENQGKKVVVAIDNAGQLVPGLVSSVIQYAAANECLRFVFALTQDEVHLKSSSDSEIDDCHFIEIPPLSESQCGIFLQNLSARPHAAISFSAVNEKLIESVYKKTHGIPGKIISELPKMAHYRVSGSNGRLVGIIAVMLVIIAAANIFIFSEKSESIGEDLNQNHSIIMGAEKTEIVVPFVFLQPELSEPEVIESEEQIELPIPSTNASQVPFVFDSEPPITIETGEKTVELQLDVSAISTPEIKEPKEVVVAAGGTDQVTVRDVGNEIGNEKVVKVVKVDSVSQQISKKKQNSNDDSEWVLAQPEKNYSIQLMMLSSRKAVDTFLKSQPSLRDQLKFFQLNTRNYRYILIYGSFKSYESASNSMKFLPAKYKKSWIRKFSSIHKETRK